MAITNEDIKNVLKAKYAIAFTDENPEQTMTVYHSTEATEEQWHVSTIFNEPNLSVYSTSIGSTKEVLVLGDHSLQDSAAALWTEWTGE